MADVKTGTTGYRLTCQERMGSSQNPTSRACSTSYLTYHFVSGIRVEWCSVRKARVGSRHASAKITYLDTASIEFGRKPGSRTGKELQG